MLAEFLGSPAVMETFLLLMLLSWLGGSAAMTLLSGQRDSEPGEPRRDGPTQPTTPPAARAVTGAPRR
jgi:hypothetical protein